MIGEKLCLNGESVRKILVDDLLMQKECENGTSTKDFVGRPKAAHYAIIVRQLLVKKEITAFDHPLYSVDLRPCDF